MALNLDISFEADKLILALGEDDPAIDQKLLEFGRLAFGRQKFTKLVKNGTGKLTGLNEYITEREEKVISPELRRLLAQHAQLRKDHEQLERRVSQLERRPAIVQEKEEPKKGRVHSNQAAITFHSNLRAGKPKAVRLNAIVELAGYQFIGITPKGNASYEVENVDKTIMAVGLVVDFQDQYGDVRLQQILNVMASFDSTPPRALYLQAIAYCLCDKENPVPAEAFYVEAEPYFQLPYKELQAKLLKARPDKSISAGVMLGKVIAGEEKLDW